MPGEHSLPSSPALSVKQTRSFDDRECLRTVASTHETVTPSKPNVDSCKSVESAKSDEEPRKSRENISLHCEINEPNNTNIRHENICAAQPQQPDHSSANANPNASDTNLESSSCLPDDGDKVQSESIALSASPPTITVICAPCTDDILAESAAQQQTDQPIDCDVGAATSDSEETAQTVTSDAQNDVAEAKSSAQHIQLTLEVKKANDDIGIQETGDLSPSMDEYQECNPTSGDYQYDTIAGEMLVPGCVAPAPTPAPLIAPLAEIEIDPPDDDVLVSGIEPQQSTEAEATTTTIKTESTTTHHSGGTDSTAKPTSQQHHQPHTSHTKKKKQKSTDKGDSHKIFIQRSKKIRMTPFFYFSKFT